VHVPHAFGHPQPNSNSVAVSHARRSRNTVPIADTDADGIRHSVAHSLRDIDTDIHADADADCHSHTYGDSHADADADGDSDCLRIGRSAVIRSA
jgi:hypothetical protein